MRYPNTSCGLLSVTYLIRHLKWHDKCKKLEKFSKELTLTGLWFLVSVWLTEETVVLLSVGSGKKTKLYIYIELFWAHLLVSVLRYNYDQNIFTIILLDSYMSSDISFLANLSFSLCFLSMSSMVRLPVQKTLQTVKLSIVWDEKRGQAVKFLSGLAW